MNTPFPAASSLRAELKPFSALSDGELSGWRALCSENPDAHRAFMSPDYAAAVEHSHGGVQVLLGFDQHGLACLIPLQRHAGLPGHMGVYEPVGAVMTDYFGAISRPGVTIDCRDLLAATGIGAVVFTHLDETQQPIGLHGEDPRIGLRTRIHGVGDEHWTQLRQLDKKLVTDTERRERKLVAEHGEISFELHSRQPEQDLAALVELKCAQYDRTGKAGAPLFDSRNVVLLENLLRSAAPECAGMLSVLRVDGKLVAAHFGLRCGDMLHVWFPVYVATFGSYSPGRILLKYIIREGSAEGIRVLDRGEGDTQAKRDFANEEHRFLRGVWRNPGWRGTLARLALSLHWRFGQR